MRLFLLLTVAPGRNLAVSIDIRTLGQPADVPSLMKSLRKQVNRLDVVFIDAIDESLAQRFNETRRYTHFRTGNERTHLKEAIQRESDRLEPIQNIATFRIDSSGSQYTHCEAKSEHWLQVRLRQDQW